MMGAIALKDAVYDVINQFDPVITMVHATAVAPLSVSFNVLDDSTYGNENLPMLSEFMWDFGDNGTANGTGVDDPYNIGKGYCTTHVYREPGTYNITMKAYLYGKLKSTLKETIIVESIDNQVDWTTYYVSLDGSDSNDGLTESTAFLTPKYAIELATTNNRVLLRNGDTFMKSSSISVGGGTIGGDRIQGPIVISSYKDASNPSDVKPVIYDGREDTSGSNAISLYNCEDIRFVDFKLQCAGGNVDNRDTNARYPSGFGQSGGDDSDYCLWLDVDLQGTGTTAFLWDGQYNVMQDCTVRDAGSYGIISGITYDSAFIGNSFKEFANDSPEYTMRLTGHVVQTYLAYNDLWGDYTKATLTIRGDDSSWNYVWNNKFDRFAGFNQTNDNEDQILHHNTFDANIITARDYAGHNTEAYKTNAWFISSRYSMVRNNISYGFLLGILYNEHPYAGGVITSWAYNNTFVMTQQSSKAFSVRQSCRDLHFKNNVYYNTNTDADSDRFISLPNVGKFPVHEKPNMFNSDYNIFSGANWGGEATKEIVSISYSSYACTLEEWQATWGNGNNSLYEDALLNTIMDTDDVDGALASGFASLGDESPAIGSADPNKVYTLFDFNNNERASLDMGAICTEVN